MSWIRDECGVKQAHLLLGLLCHVHHHADQGCTQAVVSRDEPALSLSFHTAAPPAGMNQGGSGTRESQSLQGRGRSPGFRVSCRTTEPPLNIVCCLFALQLGVS